jgi:hypothetical protein
MTEVAGMNGPYDQKLPSSLHVGLSSTLHVGLSLFLHVDLPSSLHVVSREPAFGVVEFSAKVDNGFLPSQE